MWWLPLVSLLFQAPGDGWALAQVAPRQIKTLYWDLFKTTEVYVSVIPEIPERKDPLVRFVFQGFFEGEKPKGSPQRVDLRVLGLPLTVIKDLSLTLVIDGRTIDLAGSCATTPAASGPCHHLFPVCGPDDGCAANGVVVELSPIVLRALRASRDVRGTALGFPIVFSAADRASVAAFVDQVGFPSEQGP